MIRLRTGALACLMVACAFRLYRDACAIARPGGGIPDDYLPYNAEYFHHAAAEIARREGQILHAMHAAFQAHPSWTRSHGWRRGRTRAKDFTRRAGVKPTSQSTLKF